MEALSTIDGFSHGGGRARPMPAASAAVRTTRALAPAAALLALLAATQSVQAVEQPPTIPAASVLGAQVSGANYVFDPEVHSDGFVQIFGLRTTYGRYEVRGTYLMRERLRELAALRRLHAMAESDAFRRAMRSEASAPVRFGSDLVSDPGRTLQRSASGIANMFDRASAALSNPDARRDSLASSLTGADTARRNLAFELGVDPYTDFPPLATRLSDMARAAAQGGLAIRALVMAIPGGAGTVVSAASTSTRSRELLRDQTAPQIGERVRTILVGLGVSPAIVSRLLQNRNYTPTDLYLIATSLQTLRARGSELFVARAAEAVERDEAYFQRRRAEILAQHGRQLGIAEFVGIVGFPLNRARDGRILAVFPFDQLAWTDSIARLFSAATADIRRRNAAANATLALTGTATPMAQAELTSLGWTVTRLQ